MRHRYATALGLFVLLWGVASVRYHAGGANHGLFDAEQIHLLDGEPSYQTFRPPDLSKRDGECSNDQHPCKFCPPDRRRPAAVVLDESTIG